MTTTTNYTSYEEFDAAYNTVTATFKSGKTKDLRWRKWQLKQLWWLMEDNEKRILKALQADLNRHDFESLFTDIVGIKTDILHHIENLEKWTADQPIDAGFIFGTLGKSKIRREPLGVALIIGAWNFPFLLLLQPVVAAIAAGCAVVMKPSELAPASQDLIQELVPRYLDQSAIVSISAGPREMGPILERKYDHIFYTGGSQVARIIAAAAAKHLTPTVLELGGQGPAIVTKTANVDLAAKRIAFAKFVNAGQICLSVNHVFVDPEVADEFTQRLGHWFDVCQAGGSKSPAGKNNMVTIINERNFDRLTGLLSRTEGKTVYGGDSDRSIKKIFPTVVADVSLEDSLMSEELFGPICPVIKANYKQAIKHIGDRPHPLAIYIFSSQQNEIDEILSSTNSGGVSINDTIIHASVPNAPFGGVGESGHGYYHGEYGIQAFSHNRTVVQPPSFLDKLAGFLYPPFDFKHASKIAVKNKPGFKRDETLQDQKIKSTRPAGSSSWTGQTLKLLTLLTIVAAVDARTGNRLSVAETLRKVVMKVLQQ